MKALPRHKAILEDLRCDPVGLNSLGVFSQGLEKVRGCRVSIECQLVSWIDANMAAALGGVVAQLHQRGNFVVFEGLRPKVRNVLARNGFLAERALDRYKTCIPLKRFSTTAAKAFAEYTKIELRGRGIPTMSEELRTEFNASLNEIFNNCVLHSKSELGIFVCGQVYKDSKRLDFTIVDMGRGFHSNVSEFLGSPITPSDAIEWAMTDENTTRSGDIPGGLGLKLLRDFVVMNGGSLTIYSDRGYWSLNNSGTVKYDLNGRFRGAFVNLRINTADTNSYFLDTELNPNDVL